MITYLDYESEQKDWRGKGPDIGFKHVTEPHYSKHVNIAGKKIQPTGQG